MMKKHPFILFLLRTKYKLALGSLLVIASITSVVLEKLHARINGADNYSNLIFNLFLAWIPFGAAMLVG